MVRAKLRTLHFDNIHNYAGMNMSAYVFLENMHNPNFDVLFEHMLKDICIFYVFWILCFIGTGGCASYCRDVEWYWYSTWQGIGIE